MSSLVNLGGLQTERRNSNSSGIDQVSTIELCQIINREDAAIAGAVSKSIPVIAAAIDVLSARVRNGGRVIYVGAGTSGRLGVLDASEIPPTYSAPEGQFVGLIAGGDHALRHAQEGAEDDVDAAVRDLDALLVNGRVDSLIGVAASGRTPYVLSCLSYAKSLGCVTIGVACADPSAMSVSDDVDFKITPVVGPEVVTGSTRMKAGTATKLVLNMLSTGTMIKIGKTFGNMMVDLKATNLKLQQRSRNILRNLCGSSCPHSDSELDALLKGCAGSVKLAIATLSLGVSVSEAKQRLDSAGGVLASVLKKAVDSSPTNPTSKEATGPDCVLCIDGGGSKCAAVVMSPDAEKGYGEAGGCNVTDTGVEAAVLSISLAVQRACDTHPALRDKLWRPHLFSSIWIALAGHDRKEIALAVDQALETLFKRPLGPTLKVTNDIEMLAISAAEKHQVDSAIILVAGTGSVAMSFKREKDSFTRIGRSGGWGHLLGDDGSGFDIGRQGIRLALSALDVYNSHKPVTHDSPSFQPSRLVQRILEHFRPRGIGALDFDLLSAVLSSSSDLEKKKLIAQAARIVIQSSADDPQAKEIVDSAVKSMLRLLDSIVKSQQVVLSSSILVLAGGLMQSGIFGQTVKDALTESGIRFRSVEVVDQPAVWGAENLLRERQRREGAE